MKITTKKLNYLTSNYITFVVLRNGKEIGTIEKFKSTCRTNHPWKAYAGVGMDRRFLRTFYGSDCPPGVESFADPKQAAIDAVVAATPKQPRSAWQPGDPILY